MVVEMETRDMAITDMGMGTGTGPEQLMLLDFVSWSERHRKSRRSAKIGARSRPPNSRLASWSADCPYCRFGLSFSTPIGCATQYQIRSLMAQRPQSHAPGVTA